MFELLVKITDLPVEGREFFFTDQRIWTDPITEFHLPYRIRTPFQAALFLQPQQDGLLVDGSQRGSLSMPCARCAEDFEHAVEVGFQEFEAFPGAVSPQDDISRVVKRDGLLFLDVAGLLWEQFLLALHVKTLCSPACRGICAVCGANRNQKACDCAADSSDPRWAALRSVHVS